MSQEKDCISQRAGGLSALGGDAQCEGSAADKN